MHAQKPPIPVPQLKYLYCIDDETKILYGVCTIYHTFPVTFTVLLFVYYQTLFPTHD